MKFTAHEFADKRISVAQLMTAADAQGGLAIDCRGFEEALLFLDCALTGGTTPTMTAKWRESDDGSTAWADITSAAHAVVNVTNDKIVSVVNLTNIAFTIAAQPVSPSYVTVTIVDTTPSITAGTVTIVGTRPPLTYGEKNGIAPVASAGSQAVTEAIDCSAGAGTYYTKGIFDSIVSVTASAFTVLGGSGDETIKVGVDNSGVQGSRALIPHLIRLDLVRRKRYIQGYTTKSSSGSPLGYVQMGAVLLASKRLETVPLIPVEANVT